MHVSIDDFWKLVAASELISPSECEELHAAFAGLRGAARQANARSLAEWLVATGKLTRYQAALLSAGRPGPFVFGPFVITDRVENGRLARFYRATYNGSQQALLVFLAQLTDDANQHEQLAELAQAAAAVKNPHVSRTYRAVRHRSQTFIVVEGLEGESLEELRARQRIARPAACQLGFQLALGLVAMHSEHLVHGSVCPRNIWIDTSGTAKLLQFPLVPTEGQLNRRELPLVDYLAPELADAGEPATPLTDIYGLGCTLFELVAGRPVFAGGTPQQKSARQRAEFPQRLDKLHPEIPEELADLVAEMLAKDPLLRCQTASQVAHLLAPFTAGHKQRGGHPPKRDPSGLAPGYGAWQAPEWQSPPRQAGQAPLASQSLPPAVESGGRDTPSVVGPQTGAVEIEPAIFVGTARRDKSSSRQAAIDMPLVVTTDPAASLGTLPERRLSKSAWISIGAGLVVVALVVAGAVLANRSERMANTTSSKSDNAPTAPASEVSPEESKDHSEGEAGLRAPADSEPGAATSAPAVNVVDDDGQTLWVSPTAGRPLDVAYLPSGTQVVLVLRLAELLDTPEGSKLLDALGPGGKWVETELRSTLGVEPGDVEQLTVAFVPGELLVPQAALVMRLARDIPAATLLAAWGQPASAEQRGKKYFAGREQAYYFPASGAGRVVAIAPDAMMKQIIESAGSPLLQRGVERLLASSDDQRHVTLLFTPSYLLTDGKSLLAGHLAPLLGPIREFLDESIEAVLVSAHVGEELFVEFRAVAPVDRRPLELLEILQSRYQKIPGRVETHVASLELDPYGRLVINRFPRMLELAREFTRGGVEGDQVVLRAYLPQSAAHNLVMGAELTLLESSGVAPGAAATTPAPAPSHSVAEMLQKRISLSFPRESLDRAIDILSRELEIEIVILGSDLQLEGITKNKALNNVDERDQPADAILRKLLRLANPDGKLVYVIKPDDSGSEAVFITTRQAAGKRGDKLPAGF
ncbi:MAG: protein kinase [Pirellulales bacterium]